MIIGSCNGLMPSGTKHLRQCWRRQVYVAIRHHYVSMAHSSKSGEWTGDWSKHYQIYVRRITQHNIIKRPCIITSVVCPWILLYYIKSGMIQGQIPHPICEVYVFFSVMPCAEFHHAHVKGTRWVYRIPVNILWTLFEATFNLMTCTCKKVKIYNIT